MAAATSARPSRHGRCEQIRTATLERMLPYRRQGVGFAPSPLAVAPAFLLEMHADVNRNCLRVNELQ